MSDDGLFAGRVAVATTEFPSASQTFVADHIDALRRGGLTVDVFPSRSGNGPIAPELAPRVRHRADTILRSRRDVLLALWAWGGVGAIRRLSALRRLAHMDCSRRFENLVLALPYLRHAASYRIVHCHFGNRALQLLPLFTSGVLCAPLVVTFHGYDLQGFLRRQPTDIYQPLFECARSLVATGPYMRELLLSLGAPAERIFVLPNGVRTDLIRFQPPQPPLPGAPLQLLTVGRLVEKKGIRFGLEAVAILRARGLLAQYTVVGEGELRADLEQQVQTLGIAGCVSFIGAQPHNRVLDLYARSHVLLAPGVVAATGDVETQGVALLEAQAAGLPVIATRVGGVPYTIAPANAAMLVQPGDAAGLAAAVDQLIAAPGQWLERTMAAREHVVAGYEQEKVMDRLLQHYRELSA